MSSSSPSACSPSTRRRQAFENTDLKDRLGRYHRDARKTFYGWADVWLDREFKGWDIRDDYLVNITLPGAGDPGP